MHALEIENFEMDAIEAGGNLNYLSWFPLQIIWENDTNMVIYMLICCVFCLLSVSSHEAMGLSLQFTPVFL